MPTKVLQGECCKYAGPPFYVRIAVRGLACKILDACNRRGPIVVSCCGVSCAVPQQVNSSESRVPWPVVPGPEYHAVMWVQPSRAVVRMALHPHAVFRYAPHHNREGM